MSVVSFRRFDPAKGIPYANLFDPGVSVVSTRGFEFETRPERISVRTVSCGTATYEMSGRRATLEPGDLLIAGAGAQLWGATPRRCATTCITLYLDYADEAGFRNGSTEPLLFHCKRAAWIEELSSQLQGFCQRPAGRGFDHDYRRVVAGVCAFARSEIARAENLSAKKLGTRHSVMPRLVEAHHYMTVNLREPLSAQSLSEAVGMASSHFIARYREAYGETPKAYHHRMRMKAVWREVRYSDATIAQVAANYGFSSAAAFARAFRQHFGYSARDLRSRY